MAELMQSDQAAGLRRLFEGQHNGPRFAPLLVPAHRCATRGAWLARLAQAFARDGECTLAIDAARVQIAAALGLRARYELLHVWQGECPLERAWLDAGEGLSVLPATRALEQLVSGSAEAWPEGRVAACPIGERLQAAADARAGDLVLAMLPVDALRRMAAHNDGHLDGEVLVPVLPNRGEVLAVIAALDYFCRLGVIGVFRMLFLGMDEAGAGTLHRRLAATVAGSQAGARAPELRYGGAARTAQDLGRLTRMAGIWELGRWPAELETVS